MRRLRQLLSLATISTNLLMGTGAVAADRASKTPSRGYSAYFPGKKPSPKWRVLPVRSKAEYDQKKIGGGSHQIMHGMVRCRSNPNVVYAIQDVAGPWRSVDGGKSWVKVRGEGMIAAYGQAIAVDPVKPNIVLASTYFPWDGGLKNGMNKHAGLYRSEDYGDTWKLVLPREKFGFKWEQHRGYNETIAYAPTSVGRKGARTWFAAFHGGALYRSDDQGRTWKEIFSLADQDHIYEIEPHPTKNDVVFLATSKGLLVSQDGGESFIRSSAIPEVNSAPFKKFLNNGPYSTGITSIEVDPKNPKRIWVTRVFHYDGAPGKRYASRVSGQGLFRSDDGGKSFQEVIYTKRTDEPVCRIFMDKAKTRNLYLNCAAHYFRSTDGGESWARIFPKGSRAPGCDRRSASKVQGMSVAICPSSKDPQDVLFHSGATFFKSTDGGLTLNESNDYFTGIAWGYWHSNVAFDPNDPKRFAFFVCDVGMKITENGGLWFNEGTHSSDIWKVRYQGQNAGTFDPTPGSKVIVSTIGQYGKNWLMRSEDSGQSWTVLEKYAANTHRRYFFLAFHPQKPNIVYAYDKISHDGGKTFQPLPQIPRDDTPNAPRTGITIMGFCHKQPDTVYALANTRVYRSDDAAKTWRYYGDLGRYGANLNPMDYIPTFAVDPHDPDLVYFIDSKGDMARFDGKTAKTGLGVLAKVPNNVPGNFVRVIAPDPKNKGVLYAGTTFPGLSCVFRSTDNGDTWTDVTGNLPRVGMVSSWMIVNPHTGELFRGGPFGTWILSPPSHEK